MASRSVNFDLGRDGDNRYRSSPQRMGRRKIVEKGYFSSENLGFVLVLYSFLLALPLTYTLTLLAQHSIVAFGYLHLDPFVPRTIFVALNIWFIIGWGLQLEKEARIKKMSRLQRIAEEVECWEGEVRKLEDLLGVVRQQEVEDQLLRESPVSGFKGTSQSTALYGAGNGKVKVTASNLVNLRAVNDVIRGEDEDVSYEYDNDDDDGGVEIGEDEVSDSESEGDGSE